MAAKPLIFVGASRAALRAFPDDARRQAGTQLFMVQRGIEPLDWKPMPIVGAGVAELRIRTDRAFRVFYVARFPEALYVLHAFEKKSQQTARTDLDMGRARYAALVATRETEET